MSTALDGETTRTLSSFSTLRDRLRAALDRATRDTNTHNQHVLRILGECQDHLDLWQDEHIGTDGLKLREIAGRNNSQVVRIRQKVDEANAIMQHCEFKLGMSQQNSNGQRITNENCRDDCFPALRRILYDLQEPVSSTLGITASIIQSTLPANNGPSTPPASSPYMRSSASPAVSSSRVSPASYDYAMAHEAYPVHIKLEQQADSSRIDLQDRAHLRKDSHNATQITPKEQSLDILPPIRSFQPSASLAQIPSSAAYGPIFPQPSLHASPSSNSAASPKSPYASSMLNGNDQQTVMMSPSVLHPPLSIGPGPLSFPNLFSPHGWPTSRQNQPSPDA